MLWPKTAAVAAATADDVQEDDNANSGMRASPLLAGPIQQGARSGQRSLGMQVCGKETGQFYAKSLDIRYEHALFEAFL